MKPDVSVLKWRFPFYNDNPEEFFKLAATQPMSADFELAKKLGVDFVEDFKTKTLNYYPGETYLQAFCGTTSTESRLVVTDISRVVSYGIEADYASKYFFYNNIGRSFICHDNKHANKGLGFDLCNDCAIEAEIWSEYVARFNIGEDKIPGYVAEMSGITGRNLFRANHGRMFGPPSFGFLLQLAKNATEMSFSQKVI